MSFSDIFKTQDEKDAQFNEAFILALVHRLRTPLNGARWALDTFMSSGDSDASRKTLHQCYDKIINAINMVNEILKISEINSKDGTVELDKSKINLCEIVDSILDNLDYLLKKKEVTLEYDRMQEPIYILGDAKVLDIALTNLFDNAIRYSPKGKVRISISGVNGIAKLIIKDNGIGIDKDDMRHIFGKFFRGKNAKIIDPNQSGIGLYATKKIIEIHGGKISLHSDINSGTIVEVNLPID